MSALADARRRRGWTQAELAERVGVHRSTVAAWETRRAEPAPANAQRVASLLGLPAPAASRRSDTAAAASATRRRWCRGTQTPGLRSRRQLGLAQMPEPDSQLPTDQPQLGETLRAWRAAACWSQTELAEAAGAHRSAVVAWETGRATPGWSSRARLLAAFGLPPDSHAQPAWQ